MADFPDALRALPPSSVLTPFSMNSQIGVAERFIAGAASASSLWPTANLAYLFPVEVQAAMTIQKMFWENGATVSGNVDAGIYDVFGNRLTSTGSTAQSGTSSIQSVSLTPIVLNPGDYFLAVAMDNTTGTMLRYAGGATLFEACGVRQMTSAFVLPSTVTFTKPSSAFAPVFGATTKTVI